MAGIQHLKMLEILSLYYNRISSLSEVRSLCKLKALREIDLRLNPVAKNSPDYRLFLVHELPDLRKIGKNDQSRVALMRQITKKRSFLDDSDEAVLNLVAKSNLHLGEPSSLPVSTNKELKCQLYNLQDDHEEDNDKDSAESFQPSKQDPAKPILGHNCRREKHGVQPSRVTSSSEGDRVVGTGLRVGVSFAESLQKSYSKASEEEGQHGVQIQPRIPAQWNFTPKPGNQSTNEHLKREVEELKETIQQAGKVQELADMLQESHRQVSLVFTNERLLSELAETKARHREELEQLRKAATSASAALHRKT
ncbi:hypothetical protein Z043_106451 [Scleropages formosus]|uniref:Centrosomal protein of 72 kDa-like n=1 Tax=Scleropages formosus TaxID=113540 RepID=A0A0P7V0C6_SCLFO|nr:hypothetical protein Z043_106451 [Scleropages formosus]